MLAVYRSGMLDLPTIILMLLAGLGLYLRIRCILRGCRVPIEGKSRQ